MIKPDAMQGQMEAMLAPVIKGLAESGDTTTAMTRLAESFPDMDTTALERMLTNLIFISSLIGRLNAGD